MEETKKDIISNQEIYKDYLKKYQNQDYKKKIEQMAEKTTEPIEKYSDDLPSQDAIDKVKKNKEELNKILDELPPEFYTLCKIVDGINEEKNINILLIPILSPVYDKDGRLAQSTGKFNYEDCEKYENKQKTDELYTKIITNKYQELLDKKKPFGIMYVYCSKYILQHCEKVVHYFDKNGQQTIYNIDDFETNFSKDFNDIKIHPGFQQQFTDKNGETITIKRIKDNTQTDFFGCRLKAIKLLTSLLKNDCKNIQTFEDYQKEMLNNIKILDNDKQQKIDDKLIVLTKNNNKIYFHGNENLGPKGFIKYSQIDKQILKDVGIVDEKLNKIYKKDDKEYNIGNAKKLTELYYKYANEKFLEEHNNIVKCLIGKDSEAVNYDPAGYKEVIDETYEKLLKDKQKKQNKENLNNKANNLSNEEANEVNDKIENQEEKTNQPAQADPNNLQNSNEENKEENKENDKKENNEYIKIKANNLNNELDNKKETKKKQQKHDTVYMNKADTKKLWDRGFWGKVACIASFGIAPLCYDTNCCGAGCCQTID